MEDGIWRFLLPGDRDRADGFLATYTAVRRREGRGAEEAAYYLELPFRDRTGRFTREWGIRARSYRAFLAHVLEPLEAERGGRLRILDLGAGNGWLSHRMAARGHAVAAVDLLVDDRDGLGAFRHYPSSGSFLPLQADFDRLPFPSGHVDLVVFNGSLHYSAGLDRTLAEALRVLGSGGRIAVVDSPIYQDPESGRSMLREQSAHFRVRYGIAAGHVSPAEGFLTWDRLHALEASLGLSWKAIRPCYGLRWALRPLHARLRRTREPATFAVLAGTRADSADPGTANP
jgi:SAM-dependent methyltransferase